MPLDLQWQRPNQIINRHKQGDHHQAEPQEKSERIVPVHTLRITKEARLLNREIENKHDVRRLNQTYPKIQSIVSILTHDVSASVFFLSVEQLGI